jgi:DnaJ-class molecular chaperone
MDTPLTLEASTRAARAPAAGADAGEVTCHVCWGRGQLLLRVAGRDGWPDRLLWPTCGCCMGTGKEKADG